MRVEAEAQAPPARPFWIMVLSIAVTGYVSCFGLVFLNEVFFSHAYLPAWLGAIGRFVYWPALKLLHAI